jgi:hypothetical protein
LLILSCDRRSNFQGAEASREAPSVNTPAPVQSVKFLDQSSEGQQPTTQERKLIKTGELSFETNDVKKTKSAIDAICKELNAYSSSENQNKYDDKIQYNQTIRVSADKFDLLIGKIESEALEVETKNINVQDVTEEFIDVEARLKTKKELEVRYREILKQAKTVRDILTIEEQIGTVRAEIESMEGRLKYLSSQVSYCTLNISYYEAIGTDFGFGSKLGKSLGSGWEYFLAFLLGMINVWPFLLLISVIIWLAFRWDKRKRKRAEN